MKTSAVLASLFFGSLAVAAPLNKRALVTKTETVVETVVVYTTVYPDDTPATVAPVTTEPGLFYEKPSKKPASSSAVATSSAAPAYTPPAYTPPAAPSSSSVYTPPAAPSSSSVYTPAPAPSSSAVYTPPAAVSSAAPSSVYTPSPVSSAAPAESSAPATGGGNEYSGDITIYDNTGAAGACGTALYDDMEVCAIAHGLWDAKGGSTYDYMTGEATNPYCGAIATINYNGNTATCKIMDMCPGCDGNDLDLSVATWKKLTGSDVKTRYQATWSVAL